MGDNKKNIEDVEKWLKDDFSIWLKKTSDIKEITVEKISAIIKLTIEKVTFDILQSEIDEIITVMIDREEELLSKIKVENEFVDDILNYDKDSILIPIVSNTRIIHELKFYDFNVKIT